MKKLSIALAVCLAYLSANAAPPLPPVPVPKFRADTFNIIKYGAIADGITLNTKSITAAIDACNKKGGGVVLVPKGLWLTGPLTLKNNVNLSIAKDAVLQFTKNYSQYEIIASNWEGLPAARNQSPLNATNATNIAVTGSGIVDGNGDAWRMLKKDKLTETQWKKLTETGVLSDDKRMWYPNEESKKGAQMKGGGQLLNGKTIEDYRDIKTFLRPNLLVFNSCKNVLLEGVTFQNSAAWCLHPLMCENLTVRNVYAKNPWYASNGDGIDVESCKNVLIENSTFDVGDDGICIKSGRDEEGRKRGKPTENLTVRKCVVYHAHGGFVIGSEMSGGAKNIYVDDCSFIGTDIGLRFKTTRGRGGVVENIVINNIVMKDIPAEAILFDMYYAAKDPVVLAGEKREAPKVEFQPVTEATPVFKNFSISNVVCDGAAKAIFIRGLPEMSIKNIALNNITIQADKGIDCSEAENISFNNVKLVVKDTEPIADVLNSKNITINKLSYNNDAALLVRLGGDRSSNIVVTNTNTTNAKQKLVTEFGAKESNISFK